jgi:acetamidase/formamidase
VTEYRIDASPTTVHWGYFEAHIPPVLMINSGDTVTISTVSGNVHVLPKPPLEHRTERQIREVSVWVEV